MHEKHVSLGLKSLFEEPSLPCSKVIELRSGAASAGGEGDGGRVCKNLGASSLLGFA